MTQPAASGPDQFDPAAFTVVEPRTFEDLRVGSIFRGRRATGSLVLPVVLAGAGSVGSGR